MQRRNFLKGAAALSTLGLVSPVFAKTETQDRSRLAPNYLQRSVFADVLIHAIQDSVLFAVATI